MMTIEADRATCQGHGRCYVLAPEVFSPDKEGYCAERGTTVDVAPGLDESARMAVEACPEWALTIVEE